MAPLVSQFRDARRPAAAWFVDAAGVAYACLALALLAAAALVVPTWRRGRPAPAPTEP